MKTLVLGDIHGCDTWRKIIDLENPDKIIFLGDYFDSFSISTEQQLANFYNILKLQEILPKDRVILLLGNHDYHYLVDGVKYSGFSNIRKIVVQPLLKEAVKENKIQIIHIEGKYVFSHAGITDYWLKEVAHLYTVKDITFDNIPLSYLDWNDIQFPDPYGDTISNSPIWVRPYSLVQDAVPFFNQVVGHTHGDLILKLTSKRSTDLFICDALPKEYLILENNEPIIKKLCL